MMINKVLVANRGEIAVRTLRTCKELGITSVAVFSEADREAPHVRYADEAYPIGPPPAQESYLRGERIIEVALESGAQAIHPGYGFLAESPDFARACVGAGLIFVGPSPRTLEIMGDKAAARRLASQLGFPLLAGTESALDDAALMVAAEEIGYPVLVKAVAGGGGMGIRGRSQPASFGDRDSARAAGGGGRVW
jgi:acetyl/propionyl-CoA carboxylase alpha subunit